MMFLQLDEVFEVVRSVWTTLVGLDIQPREPLALPQGNDGFLTGCVQITGACKGGVILICSDVMARRAASTVFGLPEDELTQDLLHDIIGELTNQVAGNLKALLPGQCFLCLPVIAVGADYRFQVRHSQPVADLTFEADGMPFVVHVLELMSGSSEQPLETTTATTP